MWMDAWPYERFSQDWEGVREGAITSLNNVRFVALPRPPLLSVINVQYFDNADVATIWPSANYYVDTVRAPGRLALRMGSVWPIPTRPANGIMIDYVAGYGASASSVPEVLKAAIHQLGVTLE